MEVIGCPTLDDALNALSVRIRSAEERGEKNLIFCEDRLTLLTERAVLRGVGGATFLSEVSTFARFLSTEKRVLSKQGSVVALSSIMQEQSNALSCFHPMQAEAVYETIAQLLSSRVDGALLKESAAESEGTLQRKLDDLALLLNEYEAFLTKKELVDENGYLSLLPEKIDSGILCDTNVFFFAFPSFTAQAREGVRACARSAKSVTGIFLAGREDFYTNEGARIFKEALSEFSVPEQHQGKSTAPREACLLAQVLFAPEKFQESQTKSENVCCFTAPDEAEEADAVCALIKKHVREGARLCDVAVLTDGGDFTVWDKYFKQYGIAYFADRKRPFSDHPFCKFVLSVLEGVAGGVLPDCADDIVSSVYFGEGGNEYRNYLLKFGYWRGGYKREIREGEAVSEFNRDTLSACRKRMIDILSLFPAKARGETYVNAVRSLRVLVQEERVTEELKKAFSGAEREFLKLDALDGVLDEIQFVAGSRTFAAREFLTLLESGLKALSVSMIPQSLDAVFLGDITESKFKRVKYLFCTGLTDALPRVTTDTAVIDDTEIGKLKALSVEVEPAIAVVNARARENLALNITSFAQKLYLSYPVKKGGKEQAPSEVLAYCRSAFQPSPLGELFPLNCCERATAALTLMSLKDDFEAGREEDAGKYATLYAALEERGEKCLEGGEEARVEAAGALWFSDDVSPTLLETYFECPYHGFAERGLKLRRRQEGAILPTDAGNFVHAMLERIAPRLNDCKDEVMCRAEARKIASEMLLSPQYVRLSDTGEGRYTGERLVSECAEVAAAAYNQLVLSSFRVQDTEKILSLPALSMRGKADRIDEAEGYIRIIDYKTGSFDDKPLSYYTGRKLQLQLYLLAAAEEGKAAGAFYFPAQDSFTKEGDEKFRMQGFFSAEDKVLSLMDSVREEGKKSAFYEGGGRSEKGMKQPDFEDFLAYSALVVGRAETEMKNGNIAPSPYKGACAYCPYLGMCQFVGKEREEKNASCKEIVSIVRRERGEEV